MATNDPTSGTPPMIGRQLSIRDWLAYIAGYQFGAVAPSRLVLHHTFVPTVAQWAGLRSMQGMQRFYAGKGWSAAPHVYAAPDGIWLFTPLKDVGIHAGTGNSGYTNGAFWYSIGLEMVGNYDSARPSGAVWENAKAVMGGIAKRLAIAPRQLISFHRDYTNQKSCPGWAVTKDWVFGEVDAWLANTTPPPPPPPGPIGTPTPDREALIEALMEESYKRRGEGYNSDWAFHQYAVQNGLGFPIGRSAQLQADGKSYAHQPFARDTLYNEVPNWGDVRRLSELLRGSIPPGGLGRALLDATYRAGGATFHADWAFHQYAMISKLGPPLGESATITVDGAQYSFQVFALDTLYNRVPNWSDIHRVSELAASADAASVRLRDALLTQTYARSGAVYHPDWAFHQLARSWNLGAPLSDSYRVAVGSAQYAIQVYATDTLYNVVPNWSDVRRLSQLVAGAPARPAVLSDRLAPRAAASEPGAAPFHILQYGAPEAMPTAFGARSGSKIALIVLHSDAGPADAALAGYLSPEARAMPHYYVAADGAIYQLVDDDLAAWHAGMAEWRGREQNINRVSLGIAAERGPAGYADGQLDALAWLVGTLRARHGLPADALRRWSDLSPDDPNDPAEFPWARLQQRLSERR
ncbi:MAG TPA: N-acetylmuramoyl-L-alanine amidase [Kouleothrix sp.]|uniref:peptidoglycan recognition protein family protein n=1 Tax=Kouleothrix sp. TaxID=2779161 RepID=UPI002CFB0571|nr:N-acetylmuramoyl-L-alanine amidase [Kouleothrix sp.]